MSDFCFENTAKKYHTIQEASLVSVFALDYLKKHISSSKNASWIDLVARLDNLCNTLQTDEVYSKTSENDTSEGDLEWTYDKTGYYDTVKECKVLMDISATTVKKFRPSSEAHHLFTQNTSSWGWQVSDLADDVSELKKIANHFKVSINTALIKRIINLKEKIQDGELSVRTFDPIKDLAHSTAYAVYLGEGKGGYADHQWEAVPLSNAKLYQSEEVAQEAIDKYDHYKNMMCAIIPVSLNIAPSSHTLPKNISDEAALSLQQALAYQEKKQMEDMLEKLDIKKLKERLAQLEGAPLDTATPAPLKKKM